MDIFYAELAGIICYFADVSGPPKRLIRDPASSHHGRLRQLGIAVLIAGMVAAGTVYWFGTRPRDLSDDPAMIGFNKPQTRQMGMLYGQMGVMMDDLVA